MKYCLFMLIGYVGLYSVVWLHEIGHSIFDYRYGVKDNWIRVNVKPYIFFSTPGKLNNEVWNTLTPKQYTVIAYAGIAANALCAAISSILIAINPFNNMYICLTLWMFLSLHIGEICSYLFVGSIYQVSDMAIIAQVNPKLRIPNIIVGLLFTVLYIVILYSIPTEIKVFVIIWNVITVSSMIVGKIIFTIKSKKHE